jgi:hypothetical protein
MGLIQSQLPLTELNPGLEMKRRVTFPGMAHFARTGPHLKTCRECALWTGCGIEHGYYAKGGKNRGSLKPRPCVKYKELMLGEVGPGVPHDAPACKYFLEETQPPSISSK